MHMLSLLKGVARITTPDLAGDTPPSLGRVYEYGLIKRKLQLCLGQEHVLKGVWDGRICIWVRADLVSQGNMVSESHEVSGLSYRSRGSPPA